jgi:tetratricopeptide (TPR) repeat protein
MVRRPDMRKVAFGTLIVAVIIGFLFSQEYAGKGRIFGHVYDEGGKPIEGVKVKLLYVPSKESLETTTDKDGKWAALGIRGGAWNIDFIRSGFLPKGISFTVNEFGKNPEIKLALRKAVGLAVTDELKTALAGANALFDEKKYAEALAAYSALLAQNPDFHLLWKNIGNCYFAMEQYDKAEEAYANILTKEPANSEAMLLIGNTYVNRGQNDKALEWYNKIQFDKINDPTVLYNIGTNFYNMSKLEEALKYYQKAVELQGNSTDALYQLGLTYVGLQRNAEAVATFEIYLKFDADSPRAGQVKGFLDYLKKK